MGYNATVHSGNNHFTTFTIISRTNENSLKWERSNNEVKLVSMIWGNSEYHVNMFTTTMLLTNMKYESFSCNHFLIMWEIWLHCRHVTIIHKKLLHLPVKLTLYIIWWIDDCWRQSYIYLFIQTVLVVQRNKVIIGQLYSSYYFLLLFFWEMFLVMFAK